MKTKKSVSIVCCWHCRKIHGTFSRILDEKDNKTKDYVCSECKNKGFNKPLIGNSSTIIWS